MAFIQRPPVTVSIVSHGQQSLALPLLHQLQQYSASWVAKVVLTVNIAEPDLVGDQPWDFVLEVVQNTKPQGFGVNHNAASARCDSEWLLVLNPDIRLDCDMLGALLGRASPHAGLVAPRIVEPGQQRPEPHRGLLTPFEILARRQPGYQAPAQPAWIPGMFMLFRTQAYRQIGGFDPRYFMYGEDFDVCARLRLAGWQLQIAEDVQALHDAQRASRRDWRHLRWHFISLAKVWSSRAFWRYRAALRGTAPP